MLEKISSLIENSSLTFPRILLTNYQKLGLNEKDLIFLIYIINEKNLSFNPEKISKDLNLKFEECLTLISDLTNKDLIEIKMVKENNIHKEYLSLDKLYKKIAFLLVNNETKEAKNTDAYTLFESEFGRTLSSNETMIISRMLDENGEELLKCALNEAIYNGVRNLRYIDTILAEWNKKGIKTKEDVEKEKTEFKKSKKEPKKLFDYDYLNED